MNYSFTHAHFLKDIFYVPSIYLECSGNTFAVKILDLLSDYPSN